MTLKNIIGYKSGQGHNLPGTWDSRYQDDSSNPRDLTSSRSNTNKHGIDKINITPNKNKLDNNDQRDATGSWDRELLRSESWFGSYDLWKIYVIKILNYIINWLGYPIWENIL
jgi:hypothetical protein